MINNKDCIQQFAKLGLSTVKTWKIIWAVQHMVLRNGL